MLFNHNFTCSFVCTQGVHVLVLSIKGFSWLWYRYRVFCQSQVKLFLHKAKIKNLYFHLNLLLSLFYSLCSFFFSNISFELAIFCILFFFVLGKCVLIRACYHMYTSQSRKKTFKTAWVTWTTNHTNWNWLLIGSKFIGVSITFLGHCLESYCCFCLLTLYVMFVLYMQGCTFLIC